MAKKKYYAVKRGLTRGIYLTWEDCLSQVDGYAGAVYKGFATIEEAEEYLRTGEEMAAESQAAVKEERAQNRAGEEAEIPETQEGEAIAYVDGSYQKATGEYSCGVVFFYQGRKWEFGQKGKDEELASMHNVAGEILGARTAMQEALRRGIKKLTIVYDYEGIAAWCLGRWKTNKEGTIAYKAYYDSIKDALAVTFQKVKGHSGDCWNDRADRLARQALSE